MEIDSINVKEDFRNCSQVCSQVSFAVGRIFQSSRRRRGWSWP